MSNGRKARKRRKNRRGKRRATEDAERIPSGDPLEGIHPHLRMAITGHPDGELSAGEIKDVKELDARRKRSKAKRSTESHSDALERA